MPQADLATPSAAGKWLIRLGTLELVVYGLWTLRTLLGSADFSALAGFFFLLPLWGLVGLLACYHLIRSPALRRRAALYLLAPAALLLLVSALERGPMAALDRGQVVLALVLLAGVGGLWRKRAQLLRAGHNWKAHKPVHLVVLLVLAGLSLIWLLVTLRYAGTGEIEQLMRQDEQLLMTGFWLWLGSALLCLMVVLYAALGLILPFGRSLRLVFALQLLMAGVLVAAMIVPSLVMLSVYAVALSG